MTDFNQVLPTEVNYVAPSKMAESRVVSYKTNSNYTTTSTAGTELRFVIPMTERQFLQNNTVSLSGQLDLNFSAQADTQVALLGSGWYSCFQTQQLQTSNGEFLENIPNVSILANEILQQASDISQRNALSMSWGMNPDMGSGNCSITLGTANTLYSYQNAGTKIVVKFCIPLIGLLSNSNNFLPMFMTDMTLILTVNDIIGKVVKKIQDGTAGKDFMPTSFSLSNLYLNYDALELSQGAYMEWLAQYPSQRFIIKAIGYTYTNSTIPNGTGTFDLPLNFTLASCKQLYISFQPAVGDLQYGSINPNANSIQLFTGAGEMYPSRPIDCRNPTEVFYNLQKAWGAYYSRDCNGLITLNQFCRRSGAITGYLAVSGVGDKTNDDADRVDNGTVSNKFFVCIDTEKASSNKDLVYNGAKISLNSYLRLDIAAANGDAVPVNIFAAFDSFIICDMANMNITKIN